MPRTKTFSIDSALDKAMKLFWERGYAATTILEIAEGLSRSSIYATLGHKKALFEQVLRRYGSEFRVPGLSELRAAVSPRAALVEVFRQTIASGVGKQRRDSCLLINTALELKSNSGPEIARMIEDAVLDMEMRFREAIDRSRGAGLRCAPRAEVGCRIDDAECGGGRSVPSACLERNGGTAERWPDESG